jgi:hypothetical protein
MRSSLGIRMRLLEHCKRRVAVVYIHVFGIFEGN